MKNEIFFPFVELNVTINLPSILYFFLCYLKVAKPTKTCCNEYCILTIKNFSCGLTVYFNIVCKFVFVLFGSCSKLIRGGVGGVNMT
jgi:hypothetical protein